MAAPLYAGIAEIRVPKEGHHGLWYDRFFNRYSDAWTLDETAKTAWIDTVARQVGERGALEQAELRTNQLCTALGGQTRVYVADWHFATGLGNPHPVENGFLWHPTLGTPYLSGSAVKGLVRAWVEAWMPFDSDQDRLDTLYRWFGSEDKDFVERKRLRLQGYRPPSQPPDIDTQAGAFIFFDALPIAPAVLKCDVMTPHMGKWYEQGGEIDNVNTQPERIPADWHDPKPVYFLVADKPRLQFAVAPRNPSAEEELDAVLGALDNALQWLGAGAKTAVGYGQMSQEPEGPAKSKAPDTGPTVWTSVRLQYQKGSQELSATGPDSGRAFARDRDALALIQGLDEGGKRSLERGKLDASIRVKHLGGRNWQILAIEPTT